MSAALKPMVLELEPVGLSVGSQIQACPSKCLVLDHADFAGVVGFFYHSNILRVRMLVKHLLPHQIMGCEVAVCG